MAKQQLPDDFKEFLRLLNAHGVEYLVVGGYAVGHHGYPRTTADIDLWVANSPANAERLVNVYREFGFDDASLTADMFQAEESLIRIGLPPVRIEVMTSIDGVEFAECYASRVETEIDGQPVDMIALEHLLRNKRAAGRHKDLDDLENLPN